MLKLEDFFGRGWRPFSHLALVQGAALVVVRLLFGPENRLAAQVGGFFYLLFLSADAVICFGRERWRVAVVERLRSLLSRAGLTGI